MKTATNLNSATGSVLGLAELIGISHGKCALLSATYAPQD